MGAGAAALPRAPGPARALPAYRLLAGHGHDARPQSTGATVGLRRGALAGLVVSTASCRLCGAPLEAVFADLGNSPLANSYIPPERLGAMEPFYPLRALVCGRCFLVQLEEFESPERIFSDYAYFSSYSKSWLEHCRAYVEQITARLGLGSDSQVVELASNDGYQIG